MRIIKVAGFGHTTIKQTKSLDTKITKILKGYLKDNKVILLTNFACGADQIIIKCALKLNIPIYGILPFSKKDLIKSLYKDSLSKGYQYNSSVEKEVINLLSLANKLRVYKNKKYPYLSASKQMIKECDKIIVLWDKVKTPLKDDKGKPINQGGTYYNICYAKQIGLKDKDINIIKCKR